MDYSLHRLTGSVSACAFQGLTRGVVVADRLSNSRSASRARFLLVE